MHNSFEFVSYNLATDCIIGYYIIPREHTIVCCTI